MPFCQWALVAPWLWIEFPPTLRSADACSGCSGWPRGRGESRLLRGAGRYSRQTHSRGRQCPCARAVSSETSARSWIYKSCKKGREIFGVILFPSREGYRLAKIEKELEGLVLPPARLGGLLGFSSPSLLPVSCGSYFMIWSGTGLFLNLGCSSKTGWTVKHWMSGIPELRVHSMSVGHRDSSKCSRSWLRPSRPVLLGSSFIA